ncbi:MAG: nickel pincer cofactor biosynthesis protein LarC [Kiritimatiellae bacterium]|nr:nickel pincer cofactor biosynthesis protein LarC [Kiritimatiellia bacterium]
MNRMVRFDSVGGASGDMILSCLIGLGARKELVFEALRSLSVEKFEITCVQADSRGFTGLRTEVKVTDKGLSHSHRSLREIRGIIEAAAIPSRAKSLSLQVFERLAEAEARVHGKHRDEICFHEVGAVDSIVDIVGSCIALDLLQVDRVIVGPLPLGQGTTSGSHGVLPLPVPATAELLKGHQVIFTDEPFELVTPTGAALLVTWQQVTNPEGTADSLGTAMDCTLAIEKTAYGLGHRELRSRPNLLRALLVRPTQLHTELRDFCLVLEFTVDDMLPELVGTLCRKLLDMGALDVFATPVQMKKQRPGVLLTILCRPRDRELLVDTVFRESTTFGIREHLESRTVLARRHEETETPYGRVRIKVGTWQGSDIIRSPEHEDCVRLAEQHGVPVRLVYEAALRSTGSTGSSQVP